MKFSKVFNENEVITEESKGTPSDFASLGLKEITTPAQKKAGNRMFLDPHASNDRREVRYTFHSNGYYR